MSLLLLLFSFIRATFSLYTDPADSAGTLQWHLHNPSSPQHDINVLPVWRENVFGQNVTVCIIDDGVDFEHPSLASAARPDLSFDLNRNVPDARPQSNKDRHGTRCAGQIAARPGQCGLGVAPKAQISAIRLLGDKITPTLEASAVTFRNQDNHIYSCSWGPADDGKTVEGPDPVVLAAFVAGLMKGRRGLGSIFVFAAGNGRLGVDNCNYDGFANSPFSFTIGAISAANQAPYYMEECANMLAVTYSSGQPGSDPKITTTDLNDACTDKHGGTSAAAPLAAGILALALSVRPDLTWRDWQGLLIASAQPISANSNGVMIENAAGLHFNTLYGFGRIDAHALVTNARSWKALNPPLIRSLPWIRVHEAIPARRNALVQSHLNLDYPLHWDYFELAAVRRIEHVTVSVNVRHGRRGDLIFRLCSPSRTCVPLTSRRPLDDDSKRGLRGWTFGTVAFWGETAILGTWTLQIMNSPAPSAEQIHSGQFISWRLTLWGERDGDGEEFDPDAYANDFVNNYFPPGVDYFDDVDGVFRADSRWILKKPPLAASTFYQKRTSSKAGNPQFRASWIFLLGVFVSIVSLALMYIIK